MLRQLRLCYLQNILKSAIVDCRCQSEVCRSRSCHLHDIAQNRTFTCKTTLLHDNNKSEPFLENVKILRSVPLCDNSHMSTLFNDSKHHKRHYSVVNILGLRNSSAKHVHGSYCHQRNGVRTKLQGSCQLITVQHFHTALVNGLLCQNKGGNGQGTENENVNKTETPKKDGEKLIKTEDIWTIPNLLTGLRILVTPYIGYLVLHEGMGLACILFALAGVTDWVDGYIARNFKNQASAFGSALDPLADKLLISVLTITLTMVNILPLPLAVVIFGRDLLLILAGFYIRFVSLSPPMTLKRYFDVTLATVELKPSFFSKVNTAIQLLTIAATMLSPVYGFVDHQYLFYLWYLTGTTTVLTGIDYAVQGNNYIKYRRKKP